MSSTAGLPFHRVAGPRLGGGQGAEPPTPRTQCPNCRIRIRTADPPLHCPRCLVRGMGRFELVALSEERSRSSRAPARFAYGRSRPSATLRLEQTVVWAESRQIGVSGELDLACVDPLRSLLAETVGSGLACVVLDLSGCEFLDAGALGVISRLQLRLAAEGQELVVQGASGQVARLIELARGFSPLVCVTEPPAGR